MVGKILSVAVILVLLPFSFNFSINTIENTRHFPIISSGVTFQNSTGKGVTQEMIDSFITFANFASSTYRDDIQKNAKFIKYRMDELYGKENDNFYVIIQTDEVLTNRYFWVQVDSVFASFNRINKLYPKWSYLFSRNYGGKKIAEYSFFGKDQRGKGITNQLLSQIKILIESYQLTDTCTCDKDSVEGIGKELHFLEMTSWSVICDSKGITSALIRTFGDRYLSIRHKKCYYTMYMSA